MASSFKLLALASMFAVMTTALPSERFVMKIPQEEQGGYALVSLILYYESLCGGCVDFLTATLSEKWSKIGGSGILNVTLLPFGNAQACIIHYQPKFEDHFPAVKCIEAYMYIAGYQDWKRSLQLCSSAIKPDVTTIQKCVEGDLGNQLEHAMGMRTGPHSYVPYTLINGVTFSPYSINLTATVCAAHGGPKPTGCPS